MTHPVLAERLSAQLLSGPPAADPVEVTERLLAVQGQDPRGFRLAVRARTQGLHASDVDRALTEDRSLVVTWVNRGTLHLIRSEDHPLLHAVTTPPLRTGSERRLAEEGVPPREAERGVATIVKSLTDEGPLSAEQLRERVAATGVRAQGQALYHLLFKASLDGLIVRGPIVNRKHAYVLVRDWLGEQRPVDRDGALGEFARRYLAGHGPATDRDLARWAGIPLRDARAGLAAVGGAREERPPAAELPPPKLLGAFEPVLLGWTSREDILGKHLELVTVNGLFRPFALVKGRAAAAWSIQKGKVVLEPFGRLSKADREALTEDAADVERFLG
jgi:hypothetical protein